MASYKIYRGTTLGGEVLYLSGITGTSRTDTPVTTNTTYYYKLSAVDTAGNESALTANPTGGLPAGSRIAGHIYKRTASLWIGADEIRIPSTNSGISNIAMTNGIYQMIVTWTSVPASTVRRVRIGGTTVYNEPGGGCLGAASGVPFPINALPSYTYNCNVNRDVEIRFCNNISGTTTALTAQLGGAAAPFDGQLTGLPLATWP